MNTKINRYIDELFAHTPNTIYVEELKEEMKINLSEKYEDLLSEGKTQEEAYMIATSSIGDIRELVSGLDESAVVITTKDLERRKQKSALMRSIAIMMYILCGAVIIGCAFVAGLIFPGGEDIGGAIGVVIAIIIAAAATGILVFDNLTKPEVLKEETQERLRKSLMTEDEKKKTAIEDSIESIVWVATTAAYFIISFTTGAWAYSWIIFIIGTALHSVIKLLLQLKEQ